MKIGILFILLLSLLSCENVLYHRAIQKEMIILSINHNSEKCVLVDRNNNYLYTVLNYHMLKNLTCDNVATISYVAYGKAYEENEYYEYTNSPISIVGVYEHF